MYVSENEKNSVLGSFQTFEEALELAAAYNRKNIDNEGIYCTVKFVERAKNYA